MLKSASLVTRARSSERTNIQNLSSYLYRTFKRLVLEELEKENRHRRLAAEAASALSPREETGAVTLDRKILIQQLIGRMDGSTRQVFELLILGHTYDEIGLFVGKDGQAVRTKYSKQIRKLIKKIEAENLIADERLKNSV
jgi:DNA-directed RNA polymerase specialized sigma24 family protein